MRQFLDIGTGLPTANNTHEVAQSVAPESRIVYVDNDPLVLAHARALLTSSPEGACDYLDADIRNPAAILDDRRQPARFQAARRPHADGNHWAISPTDEASDRQRPAGRAALRQLLRASTTAPAPTRRSIRRSRVYNDSRRGALFYLRSPEQFRRFFEGLELVEPGVVPVPHWRPDPDAEPVEIYSYCGVGRKP